MLQVNLVKYLDMVTIRRYQKKTEQEEDEHGCRLGRIICSPFKEDSTKKRLPVRKRSPSDIGMVAGGKA